MRRLFAGVVNLEYVDFGRYLCCDELLVAISRNCPHFVGFRSERSERLSSDGVIAVVERCPMLQGVVCTRSQVCDLAMEALAALGKNLIAIDVNECEGVSDDGIAEFQEPGSCPKLTCLEIRYTSCSHEGTEMLQESRPGLDIEYEACDW